MTKRNVSWNMIGAVVYSVITIVLATIVKRTDAGEANAFTFDFKLAQLLLTVGYFEVRVFQVTDSKEKYSFADYLGFRIFTCILMVVIGAVYFVFSGKPADAFPLLMLLVVYKMLDAFADVFEGDYQKHERIDVSGKSMALRTLFGAIAFTAVCYFTKSAVLGCIALVTGCLLVIVLYNPAKRRIYDDSAMVRPSFKSFKPLFKDVIALSLGAFVCCYLLNCCSYALDFYSPEYNYAFGAVFMPSSVINLAATIIYKPILTDWTKKADEKDAHGYIKILLVMGGIVFALTAACILGAWLLGIPVLSAVYADDLSPFKTELLIMLAGGGLNALGILLYYGLVVLRKQKQTFITYLATLAVTLPVPFLLTKSLGIYGAALAYFLIMFIQFAVFALFLLFAVRKEFYEKD